MSLVYYIIYYRCCKFEILHDYVCLRWVDLESEALLLRNNRLDRQSPCELFVLYPPLPRTCHSNFDLAYAYFPLLAIWRQCCSQGDFQPQVQPKCVVETEKCSVESRHKNVESKILANSSLFSVTSTHCDTGWYSSDDWATLACKTVTLCVLTNLKQKLTLMCIFTSQM